MSTSELAARIKAMDTWAILGEPWLDTSVPQYERQLFADELRARGIVGARGLKYRALAAGGYWWNIFMGEWGLLSYENLLQGWCLNGLLAIAVLLGLADYPAGGVVAFIVGVRPVLALGRRVARRRGAQPSRR